MAGSPDRSAKGKRIGNGCAGPELIPQPPRNWTWTQRMKDFSNASFSPELIKLMDQALQGAVATLPHPVSSMRVQNIAESILRSAKQGESDPRTLQTLALVEMQLRSDEN
jgi:hypothetical protein